MGGVQKGGIFGDGHGESDASSDIVAGYPLVEIQGVCTRGGEREGEERNKRGDKQWDGSKDTVREGRGGERGVEYGSGDMYVWRH